MIPKLSFVTLGADDVATLRHWPLTNLAHEAHATWPGRGGFSLAINLSSRDDVASALEEARAAGAQVWPPEDRDWGGFTGYFADPEGNRWEIAWAPPGLMEDA